MHNNKPQVQKGVAIMINSGIEVRVHLAAIGCNGQEISRALLAAKARWLRYLVVCSLVFQNFEENHLATTCLDTPLL